MNAIEKHRPSIAILILILLMGGWAWATSDPVTVRNVDNIPVIQLSLDGTNATGAKNALCDASGNLKVDVAAGGGLLGQQADESAFTAGTSTYDNVGGVFNDSVTALTSGQGGAARLTANRALHTNLRDHTGAELLGSKTSANSIPVVIASDQGIVPIALSASASNGYSFSHQAAATAGVTIKSGAGFLHTVTINNVGTGDITTLYDNTAASGTVIAVIGPGTETTLHFDVAFTTGLEIAISSVTTSPDITVSYK